MKLFPALEQRYLQEHQTAGEAQRLAQEIAFAPVVFQVSRLMVKHGVFALLNDHPDGLTQDEIVEKTGLGAYAAQILLEASLSIGTVHTRDHRFFLSKAGWFLLKDKMTRVNMDFVQEICYRGLFDLEKRCKRANPRGSKCSAAGRPFTRACPRCRMRRKPRGSALTIIIPTTPLPKPCKPCSPAP